METMCYFSKEQVTLADIASYAQIQGYQIGWLRLPSGTPNARPYLDIMFGSLEKHEWWQWRKMDFEEVWFDTDIERERIRSLNAKSILLFEYYPASLPQIASFLKPILIQFGGWVDCKGDGITLYTLQNIDHIVRGCP